MKRFYEAVTVEAAEGGWRVLLDGRAIRTAGGAAQIVPSRALAEALAAEWARQGEEIDASAFGLRDLTDYALDIVSTERATVIGNLLRFAKSDTLCYRAEAGEALAERQNEIWEPLLTAAEARWDIHFARIEGIIHHPQPEATLARMKAVLEAEDSFTLAALNTLASLAASLIIALAAIAPRADAEALWNAANLEEDWQAELWGKDAEAEALRTRRFAEFAGAMGFLELAGK